MKRPVATVTGLFALFLVLGGAWTGLLRFLPEGRLRDGLVVLLALAFTASWGALVLARVRRALEGRRLGRDAALLLLDLALLIAGFAALYQEIGMIDATGSVPRTVHDFWLGLYLSVVTFTTLGYGDFHPTGVGRALAAMQALTGYVILAAIASSAASVLSPHEPEGRSREVEG